MTKFIAIVSGKGGTGKTTTSLNVAKALHYFGKNVIVLDANMTTPNLSLYLGAPIVPVTLHDVLKGKNKIHEAIYVHSSGIKIIPADLSLKAFAELDISKLRKTVQQLDGHADFVIMDSAPGIGREAQEVMRAADEVLIVTNPELPAVTDALKSIKLVEENGATVAGIILTKVRHDRYEMTVEEVESVLEKPVVGVVPEDKNIRKALKKRQPVVHSHPHSPSAREYRQLVARLLGERYERILEGKQRNLIYYLLKGLGFNK